MEEGGESGAVPLQSIASISFGAGIAYNPAITIFRSPFSRRIRHKHRNRNSRLSAASHPVTVYMGSVISATGIVYKNEYRMLVLAADTLGNSPKFIPVTNITGIVPTVTSSAAKTAAGPLRSDNLRKN